MDFPPKSFFSVIMKWKSLIYFQLVQFFLEHSRWWLLEFLVQNNLIDFLPSGCVSTCWWHVATMEMYYVGKRAIIAEFKTKNSLERRSYMPISGTVFQISLVLLNKGLPIFKRPPWQCQSSDITFLDEYWGLGEKDKNVFEGSDKNQCLGERKNKKDRLVVGRWTAKYWGLRKKKNWEGWCLWLGRLRPTECSCGDS